MKLYHYSDKGSLQRVLTEGLRPGSEVDKGEKLGFVMFDSRKSHIAISNRIFYEVEIDPEDPKLRQVNAEWFEYYGTVPPSQILRYANPPADADELVELVQKLGTSSPEYKRAFDFIPVVRIYNSYEAGCELDFDFWGTTPLCSELRFGPLTEVWATSQRSALEKTILLICLSLSAIRKKKL